MFDSGNTGFMLVCAMLVLLMTPGLAFFYGGLSRRKNVVNTMIMVFGVLGIVAITWTIFGLVFRLRRRRLDSVLRRLRPDRSYGPGRPTSLVRHPKR